MDNQTMDSLKKRNRIQEEEVIKEREKQKRRRKVRDEQQEVEETLVQMRQITTELKGIVDLMEHTQRLQVALVQQAAMENALATMKNYPYRQAPDEYRDERPRRRVYYDDNPAKSLAKSPAHERPRHAKSQKDDTQTGKKFTEKNVIEKNISEVSNNDITEHQKQEKKKYGWIGEALFYVLILGMVFGAFLIRSNSNGRPIVIAGYSAFTVLTSSMESEIPKGSLVFTKAVDPETLQIGDDITYMSGPTSTITHRIIGITEKYLDTNERAFETKGVMNAEADKKLVPAANVVGKVIYHSEILGQMATFAGQNWPLLVFFVVVIVIFFIVLKWILRDDDEGENSTKKETAKSRRRYTSRRRRRRQKNL